ncbi:MAG: methylated-DNA--[protein]-cysteine S-methyltransferase [Arthrobacter sp.]|jgi:methylated-DNA-[protein]-cysteine S-methyltransferase|nr:methylated-DNA--[protein]-cysteine S-methyltransferase [Arthrobacter sp.]
MAHLLTDSPLGTLIIAANGIGLTGVWFEDHRYFPSDATLGERVEPGEHAVLDAAAEQLGQYLAGEREDFDLPLDPAGTGKQKKVWDILRTIPAGSVTTYGAIARELGKPKAAQAVGQAVGHNPLSVIVPCHRVVGVDGSMTGYAGGLERKRYLLDLEGYDAALEEALF